MWDKTFDKQAAFDGMRERGISRIEMDFSGGHDEGGVDDIYAFDAQGERVELPERKWHIGTQYSEGMETKIAYKIGDWKGRGSIPADQLPADEKAIVDFLDNIENIVYTAMLLAAASEHAARRRAMKTARSSAWVRPSAPASIPAATNRADELTIGCEGMVL